MKWINDEEFIRGNIPMTKFDIRMVTVALLDIQEGDTLLDVGAGTGSVSIECAAQGARVYSIEREEEGIDLIKKNAEKFNLQVNVVKKYAPDGIDDVPSFNKCFIGGSGGNMRDIFNAIHMKLKGGGIVAANFVTLDNLNTFKALLKEYTYKDINIRLLQSSVVDNKTGIMKAQNPVFIIRGIKA